MNFIYLKSSRLVLTFIGTREITSQNFFCQINEDLITYFDKLLYKMLSFFIHKELHQGYYIAFGPHVSLGSSACDSFHTFLVFDNLKVYEKYSSGIF